jgi:hypothetical protein
MVELARVVGDADRSDAGQAMVELARVVGDADRSDAGQAMVEFALVLPVLLILVLGLLQGVVFGVDAARVAGAAREAARAAAVGRDRAGIQAAAVRGGGGLDRDRLDVDVSVFPVASGEPVRVLVSYRSTLFVPGLTLLGVPAPVMRAEATMIAE